MAHDSLVSASWVERLRMHWLLRRLGAGSGPPAWVGDGLAVDAAQPELFAIIDEVTRRLGVRPDRVLIVGDTLAGSGRATGIRCSGWVFPCCCGSRVMSCGA